MELKQKKTIYWSVVLTLLISMSIFFLITDDLGLSNEEGVWMGVYYSIFKTLILLYLPSLIIWRVFIGKINYRIRNIESLRLLIYLAHLLFLSTVLILSDGGFFLKNISELISEYSWGITVILSILVVSLILHLILKTFIFNIIKGEK